MEQKLDAQQVLLIQTTNNGTATKVLEEACGTVTYYDTSAIVLGVNRTVNPDATAIGAAKDGRVMEVCDTLEFNTYDLDRTAGCVGPSDPGRKDEGWCGYVYFLQGMEASGPYALAAGGRSFEEVDASVCEEAMAKQCPDEVGASHSGGGSESSGDVESGGEGDGTESSKSGVGTLSLGCSIMAALFSTVASLGI